MSKIGKYLKTTPGNESFSEGDDGLLPPEAPVDVVIPEVVVVTPEELAVADSVIDDYSEVIVAQAQEFNDVADVIEESQDLLVAVEEYKALLSIGKERGEFSQSTLAAVITGMDYVKTRLGGGDDITVPSLEDFTADNIAQQYDLGLESLDGFVTRLNNAVLRGALSIGEGLWSSTKSKQRADLAKAITQKADNILEDSNNDEHYTWPSGKLAVPGKGFGKRLGQNGTVPSNPVAAIDQDLKATNWLLTQYPKKAGEFTRKVVAIVTTASNSGKGKVEDAIRPITKLALPGASLPSGMTTGTSFIGNVKLVFDPVENASDADLRKVIKGMDQNPIGFMKTEAAADGGDFQLGKADLVKLCNLAKSYAALIVKADAEWEKEIKYAAQTTSEIRKKAIAGLAEQTWAEGGLLDTAGSVLLGAPNHLSRPFSETVAHAKQAAETALALASWLLDTAEK